MTREQEQRIAVQDGGHKVLAGEMTAADYFEYYVDQDLFSGSCSYYQTLVEEYCRRVEGDC